MAEPQALALIATSTAKSYEVLTCSFPEEAFIVAPVSSRVTDLCRAELTIEPPHLISSSV